jgi:hypothetical protein
MFLRSYGYEYKSVLRDKMLIYIKHIDVFRSENKGWLMYFIWIFIFDDKIEQFDQDSSV